MRLTACVSDFTRARRSDFSRRLAFLRICIEHTLSVGRREVSHSVRRDSEEVVVGVCENLTLILTLNSADSFLDSKFIVRSEVVVDEIILEEYFELVLVKSHILFLVFLNEE